MSGLDLFIRQASEQFSKKITVIANFLNLGKCNMYEIMLYFEFISKTCYQFYHFRGRESIFGWMGQLWLFYWKKLGWWFLWLHRFLPKAWFCEPAGLPNAYENDVPWPKSSNCTQIILKYLKVHPLIKLKPKLSMQPLFLSFKCVSQFWQTWGRNRHHCGSEK